MPVPGGGTFCSLSWPRASARPRSSVMVTSHSCWTRPLLQGFGDNLGAARGGRAQEIGRIVHTDRELPAVPYRQAGAEAGGGFDGGGVDTALHHAPRGVVIWPEVDVTGDAGSGQAAQRIRLIDQLQRAQRADLEVPPPGLASRRCQPSRSASRAFASCSPVRSGTSAGKPASSAERIRVTSGSSVVSGSSTAAGRGGPGQCGGGERAATGW